MRHEPKYPLGRGEYAALRRRGSLVMERDRHADADGGYRIESLYFDDLDDSALRAALRREFIALTGIYGWPPRIPRQIKEEENP